MHVGVALERFPGERRVALTPDAVRDLIADGQQVVIETGAGAAAGFPDEAYTKVDATIAGDFPGLCATADMLVQVQRPFPDQVATLKPNMALLALLRPLNDLKLVEQLRDQQVTSFSMDTIPRIARAQDMDALSAMSSLAGYRAVTLAAAALPRCFPLMMTAAGVVSPAKVFILGAGVAGLQAIATARRLGAVVEAFDTRPAVKEQVESLGARFVAVPLEEHTTETAGGYAAQLSAQAQEREQALIAQHVAAADVVITTALVPGKRAPLLIRAEAVANMRPGSVIVDLAAESGGNCALTVPGDTAVQHGVTIIGTLNLPNDMPNQASQLYARNVRNLLRHLIKKNELQLDLTDEITAGTCITHAGAVINATVRDLLAKATLVTAEKNG